MSKIDTKQEIVQTADRLLRHKSYNSFSYNDIAEKVGIKKSSIHYHFQTKQILGVEIVRNYISKIKYLTQKLETTTNDPVEKLDAYFRFFNSGLKENLICPGLVLSVEFYTLEKEIQLELKELFDFYIKWLSKILQEGKDAGIFDVQGDISEVALYIASSIGGALIYARAYQAQDHFDRVVNRLRSQLVIDD